MEEIRGKYQPRQKVISYKHVGAYLNDELYKWSHEEATRLNISHSHFIVRALRLYQEAQRIYEERKTK